jgi:hypothetical protein
VSDRIEDGGPAFPAMEQIDGYDDDGNYRKQWVPVGGNLTVRDWFAGQALAGISADPRT